MTASLRAGRSTARRDVTWPGRTMKPRLKDRRRKALERLHGGPGNVPVRRPVVAETTALGAAYLAGLAVGYWDGFDDVRRNWALDREFSPAMPAEARARGYAGWRRAVERSLRWNTE